MMYKYLIPDFLPTGMWGRIKISAFLCKMCVYNKDYITGKCFYIKTCNVNKLGLMIIV